ncbi:MAG: hypothetical protein HC902_08125 [Calothrix sp. SM1_5_4]|nr:hypothetical protein [Calothrix sp. SM1_5_4]
MKPIRMAIAIVLALPAHAATISEHLNQVDQQRQRDHKEAFEQIKDLNYLRMKIQSIQSGLNGLNSEWTVSCKQV